MNTMYILIICWATVMILCVILLVGYYRLAKENTYLRKQLDENSEGYFMENKLTFDKKDIKDWSEEDWDNFDKWTYEI